MFYLHNAPWLMRKVLPASLVWKGDVHAGNEVYLTFDDGPHPAITPFVLKMLFQYKMKATFFCIGKNAISHPYVMSQIIEGGHSIGNHTMQHANALHTNPQDYLDEIDAAIPLTSSTLFRPPYGRISRKHLNLLKQKHPQMQTIMWDVLSGDFDTSLSAGKCIKAITKHTRPGSIIVFHDSEKAYERLKDALPATLEFLAEKNMLSVGL